MGGWPPHRVGGGCTVGSWPPRLGATGEGWEQPEPGLGGGVLAGALGSALEGVQASPGSGSLSPSAPAPAQGPSSPGAHEGCRDSGPPGEVRLRLPRQHPPYTQYQLGSEPPRRGPEEPLPEAERGSCWGPTPVLEEAAGGQGGGWGASCCNPPISNKAIGSSAGGMGVQGPSLSLWGRAAGSPCPPV